MFRCFQRYISLKVGSMRITVVCSVIRKRCPSSSVYKVVQLDVENTRKQPEHPARSEDVIDILILNCTLPVEVEVCLTPWPSSVDQTQCDNVFLVRVIQLFLLF